MKAERIITAAILLCVLAVVVIAAAEEEEEGKPKQPALPYAIVDTGQDRCFSTDKEIAYPDKGEPFFGQDAQYSGLMPAYKDNGDGTISDLNTGLMWVKTPDLRNKKSYADALADAKKCNTGGYSDWRLPTIKELYTLIDFNGYCNRTVEKSVPYINTKYFDFVYGDESKGERIIDAQYWSSTEYVGRTMNGSETVFGVNFADGRIKGYPKGDGRNERDKRFVRYVRGNKKYGQNDFADNGDETITDRATSLMWTKSDSGKPMNWESALKYSENLSVAGYNDWRLPNVKELQSIVDYTKAPDAADKSKRRTAIDPVFKVTTAESWYWTSTTHLENCTCGFAVYICFGQAFGIMRGTKMNVHGAGSQRSDPKRGNPQDWKNGNGPQGDEVRIENFVRCVRSGGVTRRETGPAVGDIFGPSRQSSEGDPMSETNRRPGFVGRLDKDRDGKVSRSEFDGPPEQFDVLDKNKDGFLTEDEAPRQPPGR